MDRNATERDGINATTVAMLLGMDNVENFADLPAGFRIRWNELETLKAFAKCNTIGDMLRVYTYSAVNGGEATRLGRYGWAEVDPSTLCANVTK